MIAACPKCNARYRVDPERLGADGARLKCAKCAAVFRVRAPGAPAPVAEVAATPVETPQQPAAAQPVVAPQPAAPQEMRREAPSVNADAAAPQPEDAAVDSARLVVVADPEIR